MDELTDGLFVICMDERRCFNENKFLTAKLNPRKFAIVLKKSNLIKHETNGFILFKKN